MAGDLRRVRGKGEESEWNEEGEEEEEEEEEQEEAEEEEEEFHASRTIESGERHMHMQRGRMRKQACMHRLNCLAVFPRATTRICFSFIRKIFACHSTHLIFIHRYLSNT